MNRRPIHSCPGGRGVRREVVGRPRGRGHALQPGAHRSVLRHLESRLVGEARVGVERAVRDGVAPADEELFPLEAALERGERSGSRLEVAEDASGRSVSRPVSFQ